MIQSAAFQTRARTIDHLGREQIADCPTAISELWKNSYDAYAKNVGLHIYDGDIAIAAIVDDGHGMNQQEFTSRWLVVGTESKTGSSVTSIEDRDGLPIRTKQGQKGIGRLSSANLGSLLLVVSKRKDQPFVASLIDWRLFENPFIYLMDIEVPVVGFEKKEELLELLPDLFERLMTNVSIIDPESDRDKRIKDGWEQFSKMEIEEGRQSTTQCLIQETVIKTVFEPKHFFEWPLWRGDAEKGTALIISGLQFDLEAQLPKMDALGETDAVVKQARNQLFQTLSNLSDPFVSAEDYALGHGVVGFSTRATARDDKYLRIVIAGSPPFDIEWLRELEHVVEGEFDEFGYFRGRVKAFGVWIDQEVIIRPPADVPNRKDSMVGPFALKLGTYEQKLDATSHSEEAYRSYEEISESYAGFMVYRNSLRVMPYGREGSDFFQIEKRRTLNAGREFWSLRRLFGRVALRKEDNPNLRDKAGREGLIDNKAAKVFRDLVVNVLRVTARLYFGSASELRESIIPQRIMASKNQKMEDARAKLKVKKRKEFGSELSKKEILLSVLAGDVEALDHHAKTVDLLVEDEIVRCRGLVKESKRKLKEVAISDPPRILGAYEEKYLSYRAKSRRLKEILERLDEELIVALDLVKPKSTRDLAYSELSANAAYLHRRIRQWVAEGKQLISSEGQRLTELQDERNKIYHAKMLPIVESVGDGVISLREASELLEAERDFQDAENADLFENYVSAIISLRDHIDLSGLANRSEEAADSLRAEVDRLHALAQLGITVEIIGHEIESLEQTVSSNLKLFSDEVRDTPEFSAVMHGHESLIDRLRFLSPLKLSGPKSRTKMSGSMIYDYVSRFFKEYLADNRIFFSATDAFLNMSLVEQPARIYPVFINLVNNSAYWVGQQTGEHKQILLDAKEGLVILSDNGPGVDSEDIPSLFQLFFTRKIRGGRGVGLYLCRTNLAAGGHTIEYIDKQGVGLSGACFRINFKGAKYV